ncbi:hypothetical protein ESZ50_09075 [Weissella muntiaci]|uniref:SCP domain-containing protein n=1 Tax=Weissella muntiaci TaxID=2508881 RepID=A0A6C2C471_9LACO|nr:CAP domain-containing protein [Weissella muntiaci]TYC48353.1 hypothetical protein ESZ50_09075 [Weissella muntiaci]
MKNSLVKSKEDYKHVNFRRWKSGKKWLYSSSVIAFIAGAGMTMADTNLVAHADDENSNQIQSDIGSSAQTVAPTRMMVNVQSETSTVASNSIEPDKSTPQSDAVVASAGAMVDNVAEENSSSAAEVDSATAVASSVTGSTVSVATENSNNVQNVDVSSVVPNSDMGATLSSVAIASADDITLNISSSSDALSSAPTFDVHSTADSSDTSLSPEDSAMLEQLAERLRTDSISLDSMSLSALPTSLASIDLNSMANSLGSLYNMSFGSAMAQLVGTFGIKNLTSALSTIMNKAGSLVPEINTIAPVVNGILGAISAAQNMGSAIGIDSNKMIADIINNGVNLLGKTLLRITEPIVKQIPLIGSNISSVITPILSDLSNISPASIVKTLATGVGLGGLLDKVTQITQTVTPVVINGLQKAINAATGIINKIKPIVTGIADKVSGPLLTTIKNLANGILAPIKNVINNVIGKLTGKNDSSSSAGSMSSSASSVASNASSNASSTTSSATTNVSAQLVTRDVTVQRGNAWRPITNFVNANDSTGKSISASEISITGTVNLSIPGVYYVMYKFNDLTTKRVIQQVASVTVSSSNLSSSNANSKTLAAISRVTSSIAALPNSSSNLASKFKATSNYPGSDTVYLAAEENFTPDIEKINGYFLEYVNELRANNNLPSLTYSADEQLFAQQRAQEIVNNFSHSGSNGSTENIGTTQGIISKLQSNQEIAYYMVMNWYDESDNLEGLGVGHYGHRANLLFGGQKMGIGLVLVKSPGARFDEYHAFEAPQYTDEIIYKKADAMAKSIVDPKTVPLANKTFVYVKSPEFAALNKQLQQYTAQLKEA